MTHAGWAGGFDHLGAIATFNPETGAAGNIFAQIFELFFGVALAQIHGEHASPRTPTKGRMFGVVIEADQIAWLGLHGHGGQLRSLHVPKRWALPNLRLQ